MATIKVSVVVPAFNAERWLDECLRSIKQQTLQPYEIIIVNDGSFDNTHKIAMKHASIVLQHAKNKGIGASRRFGASVAKGNYVAFLSADDVYHPYFLELMQREAYNQTALFCNYFRCNANLQTQNVFCAPHYSTPDELKRLIINWALQSNMFINFSTVLIPRWFFNKISFHEDLRYGEDLVFLVESLVHGLEWRCLDLPLVYYRLHEQAGTVKGWNSENRRMMWSYLEPLLLRLGVPKDSVRKAWNRQYRNLKIKRPLAHILKQISKRI